MLLICQRIKAAELEAEARRQELIEVLREGFGCGPRMPLEEQLKFLVELTFDLNKQGEKEDGG